MRRGRKASRLTIGIALAVVVGIASCHTTSRTLPSLPVSYAITYRLTENGVHHWEVVSMRRPFAGSDLVYDTAGPPARGDRASSGTISTVTALYSVDGDQVHDVSGRQP